MSDIGALVERLVEAGLSIGEAGSIIAEAFAAGVSASTQRKQPTSAAIRMSNYRDRREAMGMPRVFVAADHRPALEARDGARCIYCETAEGLVIDHIHPTFLGGDDDIGNLGLACRPCNGRKAGRPMHEMGMSIVVKSARDAHEGYKSRTQFTRAEPEHGSPIPRTTAHNRAQVHPPSISLDKNKKEKKDRGAQLPDGWRPDEVRWTAACRKLGTTGAETELQKFTSHHRAKGTVFKNWNFGWDKWLLNSDQWGPKRPAGAGVVNTESIDWRPVLQSYQKFGNWPKGYGNDPGSPSCRAPPELLREFGFNPGQ